MITTGSVKVFCQKYGLLARIENMEKRRFPGGEFPAFDMVINGDGGKVFIYHIDCWTHGALPAAANVLFFAANFSRKNDEMKNQLISFLGESRYYELMSGEFANPSLEFWFPAEPEPKYPVCKRCGHGSDFEKPWIPRGEKPKRCPKCGSAVWQTERTGNEPGPKPRRGRPPKQ